MSPAHQRREVYYAGNVQGVGFRYTARSLAETLPVTGYVENLPDGRVHLVIEGEPEVVEQLLARIEQTLGRNIRSVDRRDRTATGEFFDFSIRR